MPLKLLWESKLAVQRRYPRPGVIRVIAGDLTHQSWPDTETDTWAPTDKWVFPKIFGDYIWQVWKYFSQSWSLKIQLIKVWDLCTPSAVNCSCLLLLRQSVRQEAGAGPGLARLEAVSGVGLTWHITAVYCSFVFTTKYINTEHFRIDIWEGRQRLIRDLDKSLCICITYSNLLFSLFSSSWISSLSMSEMKGKQAKFVQSAQEFKEYLKIKKKVDKTTVWSLGNNTRSKVSTSLLMEDLF